MIKKKLLQHFINYITKSKVFLNKSFLKSKNNFQNLKLYFPSGENKKFLILIGKWNRRKYKYFIKIHKWPKKRGWKQRETARKICANKYHRGIKYRRVLVAYKYWMLSLPFDIY